MTIVDCGLLEATQGGYPIIPPSSKDELISSYEELKKKIQNGDKLSKITAKAQSRLLLEELAEFYPEVIIDT